MCRCGCGYHESDSEYDEDSELSDREDMNEELQASKVNFNEGKQVERAEAKQIDNNTLKVENKENPNSNTQWLDKRVKASEKEDAETMETEANSEVEENSSQLNRPTIQLKYVLSILQ